MIRGLALAAAIAAALVLHLAISTDLPVARILDLAAGQAVETFEDAVFVYAAAPRAAIAVLVGAALGLAGSVLQQLTQNRLVSPLTVGAAQGAWLALVVGAVVAPVFTANHGLWLSMAGAVAATALVAAIAGRNGLAGLPVVLAGMAVTILLGAIAAIVILLNEQYVRNLFIWGAGDLTQTDWGWVGWLAPQLAVGLVLLLAIGRPLTLMRLGSGGAGARGLGVVPFILAAALVALWMTASAITAVGVIGFIGLLAPNLARMAGARTARDELVTSLLLGALLLLVTDALAVEASAWSRDLVPSGASAALVGAPALIWLSLGHLKARDQAAFTPPGGTAVLTPARVAIVGMIGVAVVTAAFLAGPGAAGWQIGWPGDLVMSLRWPRIVTALAAGAGMAVSGVILQRLLHNPLASPEIIGISAGATLALVGAVLLLGVSIHEAGAPVAMLGGVAVLALVLLLGRRHGNAPSIIVLAGISLDALLDAALQFALASGGEETYTIIGWLAGSTYRATAAQAITLSVGVAVLLALCLALNRWLALLSLGDAVAASRGVATRRAKPALLALGAVLAALVTSIVGPVAFVGLIAPHMAALLGARHSRGQLLLAAALGSVLFVASDWAGRTLLYPLQLPSGAVASILGGAYFILLLARRRTV